MVLPSLRTGTEFEGLTMMGGRVAARPGAISPLGKQAAGATTSLLRERGVEREALLREKLKESGSWPRGRQGLQTRSKP